MVVLLTVGAHAGLVAEQLLHGDHAVRQARDLGQRQQAPALIMQMLADRDRLEGRRTAVILSGGNVDRPWYRTVLDGGTPLPG